MDVCRWWLDGAFPRKNSKLAWQRRLKKKINSQVVKSYWLHVTVFLSLVPSLAFWLIAMVFEFLDPFAKRKRFNCLLERQRCPRECAMRRHLARFFVISLWQGTPNYIILPPNPTPPTHAGTLEVLNRLRNPAIREDRIYEGLDDHPLPGTTSQRAQQSCRPPTLCCSRQRQESFQQQKLTSRYTLPRLPNGITS